MSRLASLALASITACAAAPAPTAPVASASSPPPCPSVPTAQAAAIPPPSAPVAAIPPPSASAPPVPAPSASITFTASASASAMTRPPTPIDPPIPSTPIAGTVDGRPFTAASALAVSDPESPGSKVVWLFDRAVACGAKLPPPGTRAVSFNAPWESGTGFGTESLSGGAKPTFFSVRGDVVATAPQARILVRVRSNAIQVEGEVRPTVCP